MSVPTVTVLGAPDIGAAVGAKAQRLSALKRAGFEVPEGRVVRAEEVMAASPDQVVALARELMEALGGRVAVRSSSTSEDSVDFAHAGVFPTHLNVDSAAALAESLVVVADAIWRGGVLIMPMVRATCAGVTFTADPRTGERDVLLIEAVHGLGDALVSGSVTPERWRICGGEPERLGGPEVLDKGQIAALQTLCRKVEAHEGGPQDIEWAFEGSRLVLLQSRPITALPAEPIPIVEALPDGSWREDDHNVLPCPATFDAFHLPFATYFAPVLGEYGVPLERREYRVIRGRLYDRFLTGGGDGAPPPRWVMWLIARLVPSMRAARRVADTSIREDRAQRVMDEWERREAPALAERAQALDRDLDDMDDETLVAHLRALHAHVGAAAEVHLRTSIAGLLAVAELHFFAEDRLGWTSDQVGALLRGYSPGSSVLARGLQELRGELPAVLPRALQLPIGRHTLARLHEEVPEVAQRVERWLYERRLSGSSHDLRAPPWSERPELILQRVAQLPAGGAPMEALSENLDGVPAAERAEFQHLLSRARQGYALRDGNYDLTIGRPFSLFRRGLVQLGERLVRCGALPSADLVFYLTCAEACEALSSDVPVRALAHTRRGEQSWARRNPGPRFVGPAYPPPDWRLFPGGLGRSMRLIGLFSSGV